MLNQGKSRQVDNYVHYSTRFKYIYSKLLIPSILQHILSTSEENSTPAVREVEEIENMENKMKDIYFSPDNLKQTHDYTYVKREEREKEEREKYKRGGRERGGKEGGSE